MNGCQNLCYKIALWTPVNSSEMNRVKVGFTHSTSSMGTVQVPNKDRVTGGFSPLSWRAVLSVPRPSLEVERRWPPSAEAGSGHPCPARCGWCDGTEGWGGEGLGLHSWPPGAEPSTVTGGALWVGQAAVRTALKSLFLQTPQFDRTWFSQRVLVFQLTDLCHPHGAWKAPGHFCTGVVGAGSPCVVKGPMSTQASAYILEKFA